MAAIQQGSVVWAQLPQPSGRRPVVILTRDSAIGRLNNVTVAPITRTIRGVETDVTLEPADGVPTVSAITLDNIFTIQRVALGQVITNLPRAKLILIFAAIHRAFDMP